MGVTEPFLKNVLVEIVFVPKLLLEPPKWLPVTLNSFEVGYNEVIPGIELLLLLCNPFLSRLALGTSYGVGD